VATVRPDDEAFEALFTAEYARVAGIANRVLADPHEAEDVAQEVSSTSTASTRQRPVRPCVAASGGCARRAEPLTRSSATAAARGRASRRGEQPVRRPAKQVEINEDRRRVRQALARMAPKPAAVLVLRASGLSYAEVGQALGVGTGQVGTLLRRAESALRKEVTRGSSF